MRGLPGCLLVKFTTRSAHCLPQVRDVHVVTFITICVVFFICGLTLRTTELKEAFTRRTALGTLFGFVSIIGITPILGWAARSLPLVPAGFATGLAIFCIMPTTLGVGVSLVNSAKVSFHRLCRSVVWVPDGC